ncbi:MAG TPA: HD domain-containing protein [Firmicutes bacterium]|nr:HD domain-containing protein [Bacillota bacterium]
MRRVKITALRPGMRLGSPVYSSRGLLLKEGVQLAPGHIERLRQARVEAVYIDDPLFSDVELPPDISWSVKGALLQAFATIWAAGVQAAGGQAGGGQAGGGQAGAGQAVVWRVPYQQFLDVASALEDELRGTPAWAVQPVTEESEEDAPVAHAVNVALLAAAVARQASLGGYVRELALGGLFHDLGLALLPAALQSEPDLLSAPNSPASHPAAPPSASSSAGMSADDVRLLQAHPLLGVKLLRGQPASAFVQAAVAQHHERFDGSGYPQKLSGSRLSDHAQLVAIADNFDRLGRQAGLGRSEAWEYVVSGGGSEFDLRLVRAFAQVIPPFPLGSTVQLNTGETGVVVGLEAGLLTRPKVRLLRDTSGETMQRQITYDLAQSAHRNRVIVGEGQE